MIIGTGIDIIEIGRIKKVLEKHQDRFLKKILSEKEIEYCTKKAGTAQHIAGRFAAKESVMKVLGTGWAHGVDWKNIVIAPLKLNGRPEVELLGKAAKHAEKMGIRKIFLSISHSDHYAVAFAVGES